MTNKTFVRAFTYLFFKPKEISATIDNFVTSHRQRRESELYRQAYGECFWSALFTEHVFWIALLGLICLPTGVWVFWQFLHGLFSGKLGFLTGLVQIVGSLIFWGVAMLGFRKVSRANYRACVAGYNAVIEANKRAAEAAAAAAAAANRADFDEDTTAPASRSTDPDDEPIPLTTTGARQRGRTTV